MMPQGQSPQGMGGGGSPMGGGMPPGSSGSPQGGGNRVDMEQVLMFFQQTVKSLVASGLSEEQAITKAMQMVSQKYGPAAAQQLMMAAQQAGGQGETQGPAAGGPGQYGPAAPGSSGMA
jgi:hypothetical protein